jgi:riboflavin kinase/FMN adenylyltransferase
MEVVRLDSPEPRGWPQAAVAVGNFDGVHRGHQALVALAVRDARAAGGTSVVLTFEPHPARVLSPDRAPVSLTTLDQKAEILAALGVDRLAVLPFTVELSRREPEDFARDVLHQALGARVVVVGSSFRFGRGRSGDLATLRRFGETLGFQVHGLRPVIARGGPISSTRIREALSRGAVDAAKDFLGRRFFVDGVVVKGEGRGRRIGIPTANLDVVNETVPGGGVYACWCRVVDGGSGGTGESPQLDERARIHFARAKDTSPPRPAAVNVGRRPTFGGGVTMVEAHLLDYEGDLYGRTLRLEFEERLREERTFPGAEALVAQIRSDIIEARRVLRTP